MSATLIAAGITAAATARANRKNRENADKSFDKTNAYNTPLAQRQRMEAAGLNPNLMYGSGTVANTSQPMSIPNQEVPNVELPNNPLEGYQSFKAKDVGITQQAQNLEAGKAQIEKTKAETANSLVDVAQKGNVNPLLVEKAIAENLNLGANTRQTEEKTKNVPYERESLAASTAKTKLETEQIPKEWERKAASINANIKSLDASTKRTLKETGYLDENQDLKIRQFFQDMDIKDIIKSKGTQEAKLLEFQNKMKEKKFSRESIEIFSRLLIPLLLAL